MSDTADFFRSRLDQMIDLRHPLAVLPSRMTWQELEASVSHLFARKVRAGKVISEGGPGWRYLDEVGRYRCFARRAPAPAATPDDFAPGSKHAFNESDEGVIGR